MKGKILVLLLLVHFTGYVTEAVTVQLFTCIENYYRKDFWYIGAVLGPSPPPHPTGAYDRFHKCCVYKSGPNQGECIWFDPKYFSDTDDSKNACYDALTTPVHTDYSYDGGTNKLTCKLEFFDTEEEAVIAVSPAEVITPNPGLTPPAGWLPIGSMTFATNGLGCIRDRRKRTYYYIGVRTQKPYYYHLRDHLRRHKCCTYRTGPAIGECIWFKPDTEGAGDNTARDACISYMGGLTTNAADDVYKVMTDPQTIYGCILEITDALATDQPILGGATGIPGAPASTTVIPGDLVQGKQGQV